MRRVLLAVFLALAIFFSGAVAGVPVEAHEYDRRWECLAHYESTHRWHYNGSSGYDGGLQFSPYTWSQYTDSDAPTYAWQATRRFQIKVARRVVWYGWRQHEPQGWTAWRKNWWKCN